MSRPWILVVWGFMRKLGGLDYFRHCVVCHAPMAKLGLTNQWGRGRKHLKCVGS